MFMFKSKLTAPPTVPTDKIIPVHYWDDTSTYRSLVSYVLFRVDDALDVQRLEAALVKLLNRDGWRKLGARLRLNSKGKLEYHVPAQFDDQRPPISFHHEPHQISITEHSLASRMPKVSTSPQFVGRTGDFETLMRRPEDPKYLDDYLYTDRPVIGLRIVSFTDATLITTSWSHVLADVMGRKALLDAWSLVLQGREDEVLPLHGVEADPMATLGTHPTEPYHDANKQLGTWQMMILGLRYAFDRIIRRPKPERRVICVPAAYVQSLRDAALADIKAGNKGENKGGTPPFVSEGDVVCAWWTRHLVSYIPPNPSQTIAIFMAFGLRWLMAKDVLPASRAYFSNATTGIHAFLSAKDVLTRPLGYVAAIIRKALAELGTREQIEARLAIDRTSQEQTGLGGVFGDPWMHMVLCTNLTKGKLYDVDFSPAVVKEGRHMGGQKAGRPSYIQTKNITKGSPLIGACSHVTIVGKDADGNCWIISSLNKDYWPNFEQELSEKPWSGDLAVPLV